MKLEAGVVRDQGAEHLYRFDRLVHWDDLVGQVCVEVHAQPPHCAANHPLRRPRCDEAHLLKQVAPEVEDARDPVGANDNHDCVVREDVRGPQHRLIGP